VAHIISCITIGPLPLVSRWTWVRGGGGLGSQAWESILRFQQPEDPPIRGSAMTGLTLIGGFASTLGSDRLADTVLAPTSQAPVRGL